MATHAFIVSWLMSPSGKGKSLGVEWSVGFRGQEYANVEGMRPVMTAKFTYSGGGSVGVSPASSDPVWDSAFSGKDSLMFCGYYWWKNAWFGGFIDHWPINEGNRNSRGLENADGQFELAWKLGVKKFCFVITDGSSRRTNFGVIER